MLIMCETLSLDNILILWMKKLRHGGLYRVPEACSEQRLPDCRNPAPKL